MKIYLFFSITIFSLFFISCKSNTSQNSSESKHFSLKSYIFTSTPDGAIVYVERRFDKKICDNENSDNCQVHVEQVHQWIEKTPFKRKLTDLAGNGKHNEPLKDGEILLFKKEGFCPKEVTFVESQLMYDVKLAPISDDCPLLNETDWPQNSSESKHFSLKSYIFTSTPDGAIVYVERGFDKKICDNENSDNCQVHVEQVHQWIEKTPFKRKLTDLAGNGKYNVPLKDGEILLFKKEGFCPKEVTFVESQLMYDVKLAPISDDCPLLNETDWP